MSDAPLVIFSHGKESGPWGSKIAALAQAAVNAGANVASIDYSDQPDPDLRVKRLLSYEKPPHDKLILVGSSMGAYVSTVASEELHPDGLFLLAPALYMKGYTVQNLKPVAKHTQVIHGLNDDIVPIAHSRLFVKTHPTVNLLEIEGDHRLMAALPLITGVFETWLKKVLA